MNILKRLQEIKDEVSAIAEQVNDVISTIGGDSTKGVVAKKEPRYVLADGRKNGNNRGSKWKVNDNGRANMSGRRIRGAEYDDVVSKLKEIVLYGMNMSGIAKSIHCSPQIISDHISGMRHQNGAKVGCIKTTLAKKIVDLHARVMSGGVTIGERYVVDSGETKKRIAELVSAGFTGEDIVRGTGLSAQTISNYSYNGVGRRYNYKTVTKHTNDAIEKFHREKLSTV